MKRREFIGGVRGCGSYVAARRAREGGNAGDWVSTAALPLAEFPHLVTAFRQGLNQLGFRRWSERRDRIAFSGRSDLIACAL